jgi:plastocyanin domain-containing protein
VLAFVGFMVYDSGKRSGADHPIDESIPITNDGGIGSGAAQTVSLRATAYGYDKETINVKAGQPVKFEFSADPNAGCGRQVIIDNVGVNLVSRNGETVSATFTPPSPGTYSFHCGMYMFRGSLIAT